MTGRIWELKSTGSEGGCLFVGPAVAVAAIIQTVIVRITNRTRCGKGLLMRSIQKRFWMIILHQTGRSWKASNLKRSGAHRAMNQVLPGGARLRRTLISIHWRSRLDGV